MVDKKTFTLLIAGSRTYNDYAEFCRITDYMLSDKLAASYSIEIVSGGANGTDTMAERYAKERGYQCTVMRAEWDTYGKGAGYLRNKEMHSYIAKKKEQACLCFWSTKEKSKGTRHNFELALVKGTQIAVYDYAMKCFLTHQEILDNR